MNQSTYFNYNLPQPNDMADISKINSNFINLDAFLHRTIGENYSNPDTLDTRVSAVETGANLEKSATNSFDDGIDSYFKKVVSTIVPLQVGSGAPSPTNVRAISGFTECTVTDTNGTDTNTATIQLGENLLNITATTQTINNVTFTVDGGTVSVSSSGSASATTQLILGEITLQAETTYTLKGCPSGGSGSTYALYIRGTTGFAQVVDNGAGVTFTPSANVTTDVRIIVYSGADVSNVIFNPKIIKPVYGGEVELTTGALKVTYDDVDLGSLDWSYDSTYGAFSTIISGKANGKTNYICSEYATSDSSIVSLPDLTTTGQTNSARIYIKDTAKGTDPAAFKTAMAGAQLVYELATPQTYQLTPAQLRSLVGANRLTSSTGEVTEVEYITNETIAWLLDLIRAN